MPDAADPAMPISEGPSVDEEMSREPEDPSAANVPCGVVATPAPAAPLGAVKRETRLEPSEERPAM
jgi:hypothetical protein